MIPSLRGHQIIELFSVDVKEFLRLRKYIARKRIGRLEEERGKQNVRFY
jgi:hypothetical protein